MLLDKIPGYKEAIAQAAAEEEALRDLAFLEADLDICEVPVRQLTPRHLLLLFAARSPFLCGGVCAPEHIAQFLWIVSPAFVPDGDARQAFLAVIGSRVEYEPARIAIEAYVAQALMDRPGVSGAKSIAITSFVAVLVHIFASAYGWTRREILDTPLAALYQLRRLIERERNPKAIFFNRLTDKAQREIVNAWRRKEQAREKRRRKGARK